METTPLPSQSPVQVLTVSAAPVARLDTGKALSSCACELKPRG